VAFIHHEITLIYYLILIIYFILPSSRYFPGYFVSGHLLFILRLQTDHVPHPHIWQRYFSFVPIFCDLESRGGDNIFGTGQ